MKSKNDHEGVSVIGRSLSSAVTTYVAAERDVHKLVLITPFDSMQDMAQAQFPIFPMRILLRDKYDSYGRARRIKADTLVIAAEKDQVIGMSHTKRLIERFSSHVWFEVIEGADHNDISAYPRFHGVLSEFL